MPIGLLEPEIQLWFFELSWLQFYHNARSAGKHHCSWVCHWYCLSILRADWSLSLDDIALVNKWSKLCTSLGGSHQELTILPANGWRLSNVSIMSRQGENSSYLKDNRTLMVPAVDFDPLGGHTIWQVKIIHFEWSSYSYKLILT